MSDPLEYTVGWICAIPAEFIAAKLMLDETHDDPETVVTNDNNSYALGRVGRHNVAIAVLPDGEYGTNMAAAVARDMLHSFTNIRIGLMVGIGGGAPSAKHDVRLGDVVVSSPQAGNSGVFQYDFGKTVQEKKFQTTGYLNLPPIILRTAVSNLKMVHETEGPQLDDIINQALLQKPRLRQKFGRQDPNSDRLYRKDFVHADESADCAGLCDREPSNWDPRPTRKDDEDSPVVHYGLIASANQLMKDARIRDTLAVDKGVLCFEMEAAGLMNHFPCLVIRGICDYADSHKNEAWQGYAAMTAAACAKQLLAKIVPNKLKAEKKFADIILSVQNEVKDTKDLTSQVHSDMQTSSRRQQIRDIQEWLKAPDPSTNYNKAKGQRHLNSGSWVLQHKLFSRWKTRKSSCLWLYGISGCGKTILSSTVIKELQAANDGSAVLYFYFDFSDTRKQKLDDLVRSLIIQLASFQVDQELLNALFSSCNRGQQQPSPEQLQRLLSDLLNSIGEAWIVIDALDESSSRTGGSIENVLMWLEEFLSIKGTILHIAVTSRPEPDIENAMNDIGELVRRIPLQGKGVDEDISSYLLARLKNDRELRRWRNLQKIQELIKSSVLYEAGGMFRLVACRLDMLGCCMNEQELSKQLRHLPHDLGEVYTRILRQIPEHRLHSALRILQLLQFSAEPLSVTELCHAIATETDEEPYWNEKKCLADPNDIAVYCSGLTILVNQEDGEMQYPRPGSLREPFLQLSHLSVKEYLCSSKLPAEFRTYFEEQAAKLALADVCVSYLLQIRHKLRANVIRYKFPFAQYCADNWPVFGQTQRKSPDHILVKTVALLQENEAHFVSYDRLNNKRVFQSQDNTTREAASPLYYASFYGLASEVNLLLEQGADVNEHRESHGNALQAALSRGHQNIVEMLSRWSAKMNVDNNQFLASLQYAVPGCDEKFLRTLLNCHTNLDIGQGWLGASLYQASSDGRTRTVQLLLDHCTDVNYVQYKDYHRALEAGLGNRHNKIAQLLLDHLSNIKHVQCEDYARALVVASAKGPGNIVQLLLDRCVEVDTQDSYYGRALEAASLAGSEGIVRMLLDRGVEINAQGGYYRNSLEAASGVGSEKVVRLLLDRGADINARGDPKRSALRAASAGGFEKIVGLLLHRDTDIDTQGTYYGSALQAASAAGSEKIVQLLLDRGADVNAEGGYYGDAALRAALAKGSGKIVQLLLDRGADINAEGSYYGDAALRAAFTKVSEKTVRLVVDCDVDINTQGGYYENAALRAALANGSENVVRILLGHDADIDAQGDYYGSPPQTALEDGSEELYSYLSVAQMLRLPKDLHLE